MNRQPPRDFVDRDVRQRALVPPSALAACHALVIGVGAIGRQVALQLAALGLPRMGLIDDDVVCFADQSADRPVTSGPARGAEQNMRQLQMVADHGLQLIGKVDCARQHRCPTAVNAVAVDCFDGCTPDIGVGGEAEIILRGEVLT